MRSKCLSLYIKNSDCSPLGMCILKPHTAAFQICRVYWVSFCITVIFKSHRSVESSLFRDKRSWNLEMTPWSDWVMYSVWVLAHSFAAYSLNACSCLYMIWNIKLQLFLLQSEQKKRLLCLPSAADWSRLLKKIVLTTKVLLLFI